MRNTALSSFILVVANACAMANGGGLDRTEVPRCHVNMRETVIGERHMNVTSDLTDKKLRAVIHKFHETNSDVFGVWTVPGREETRIVFAEGPAVSKDRYGPQVFIITHRLDTEHVLHTTSQMMDADYFDPAFFCGDNGVLVLADFGSEDSWGLIAMHIAGVKVEDLGIIPVVRPGSIDFTESALPVAQVFVERDQYVISFDGEVVESPGEGPTKWLARSGERAVFTQVGKRFELLGTK